MATVDDYIAQVRAKSEDAGPIGRFFATLYDEELAETEMTLQEEGHGGELAAAITTLYHGWIAEISPEDRVRLEETNRTRPSSDQNGLLTDIFADEAAASQS